MPQAVPSPQQHRAAHVAPPAQGVQAPCGQETGLTAQHIQVPVGVFQSMLMEKQRAGHAAAVQRRQHEKEKRQREQEENMLRHRLVSRDEQVSQQEASLQRAEAERRALQLQLSHTEDMVRAKDATMANMAADHDQKVDNARNAIADLARQAQAKDAALHEKDVQLRAKDAQMIRCEAELGELMQRVEVVEAQAQTQTERVKSKSAAAEAAAHARALACRAPGAQHEEMECCRQALAGEQHAHAQTRAHSAEVAAELSQSTAAARRLRSKLASCTKDIGEEQRRGNRAITAKHDAQAQVSRLEAEAVARTKQHAQDMTAMHSAKAQAEAHAAESAGRESRAVEEAARLRAGAAMREAAATSAVADAARLRDEVAALQGEQHRAQQQIGALRGANGTLAGEQARLTAALAAKTGEAEELQARLNEVEEWLGREVERSKCMPELQTELQQARAAARQAQQEARTAQSKAEAAQEEIERCRAEKAVSMREVTVIELERDRLRLNQALVSDVMEERAQLTQQVQQAQLQLTQQAAEIAQLHGTLKAARELATQWMAEPDELRSTARTAQAAQKTAEAVAQVAGAREAEAKSAAEAAQKLADEGDAQVVKLRAELGAAQKIAAALNAEAVDLHGAAAAEVRPAMGQADIKQLQAGREELRVRNNRLLQALNGHMLMWPSPSSSALAAFVQNQAPLTAYEDRRHPPQ